MLYLGLPHQPSPEEIDAHDKLVGPKLTVIFISNFIPRPARPTFLQPCCRSQMNVLQRLLTQETRTEAGRL